MDDNEKQLNDIFLSSLSWEMTTWKYWYFLAENFKKDSYTSYGYKIFSCKLAIARSWLIQFLISYWQGHVPLISTHALHQLHIFIFFLAVFHVIYSAITMALGRLKVSSNFLLLPSFWVVKTWNHVIYKKRIRTKVEYGDLFPIQWWRRHVMMSWHPLTLVVNLYPAFDLVPCFSPTVLLCRLVSGRNGKWRQRMTVVCCGMITVSHCSFLPWSLQLPSMSFQCCWIVAFSCRNIFPMLMMQILQNSGLLMRPLSWGIIAISGLKHHSCLLL